jgi:glycosyltransferase involved in cell wall biosynthesis
MNKIAVFTWESVYGIRVGGLAPAVTGLVEALARRGLEPHVFTRWKENLADDDEINGVHYHRCKFNPGGNPLEFSWNMCRAMVNKFDEVERREGTFDLIHGHDWHVVDALNELKNRNYPTVLTFHSTEYGRNGGAFGGWWEFGEVSGKEWYGGYIADRVTTVSQRMKGELMWLYRIPEWKIDVVSNGIQVEKYRREVDPGRIKEKYGIHPLAPLILFAGRLTHQKGPDLFIETIPRVLCHRGDAKFIVVGHGEARGYLEYRAQQLGISHTIRFTGWLPDDEYLELLNACDIVCIPSRNEPFGLILLEAWSAGKAVVATNVGGLNENIENFVNGIKVFPHPESIAWGINYIINDASGVKWIGENGRRKAKNFGWDSIAEKMIGVYKKTRPL